MPEYEFIQEEVKHLRSSIDILRHKYLKSLSDCTGRNTITYYCGIDQKTRLQEKGNFFDIEFSIPDKNSIIDSALNLDSAKGLDIILHCPDEGLNSRLAIIESIIDTLHERFGNDIRAVIPQVTSSSGTAIALSCKAILMDNNSNLMPIDPKIAGFSANGVLDEVEQAFIETTASPTLRPLWSSIIGNYDQDLVTNCQDSIIFAVRMIKRHLISCMLKDECEAKLKADKILEHMTDFYLRQSINRHISLRDAKSIGLNIISLNNLSEIRDIITNLHHLYIQTFARCPALKIIENQNETSYIQDIKYK